MSQSPELHIQVPQQTQQPAPTQAPAPAPQPTPQLRVQPDVTDGILNSEQVETLLRGFPLDREEEPSPSDQAQMAGEFFGPPAGQQQAAPTQAGPDPGSVQAPPLVQSAPAVPTAPQAPYPSVHQQPQQPQQVPQQVPVQVQPTPQQAAFQAEMALLRQQNLALQQQLSQRQAPTQPAQPTPQAQQQQQAEFNFNVPDNYLAALAAEDPNTRRAALNGLLNGVANSVSQRIYGDLETRFAQVPVQAQQAAQHVTRLNEIRQDMYGTYPELANYKEYVATAANGLGVGAEHWNEDVRDAIAERLSNLVPGLAQKVYQNRAQRIARQQAQQPYQQPFQNPAYQQPQVVQMPPVVPYAGWQVPQAPVGGAHGQIQPQPIFVRDQNGNLVPIHQPPGHVGNGAQTRPGAVQVDQELRDIWNTLGF